MSSTPQRVRCSPLGRQEVVADVVATEWVADPNGIRPIHTVDVDGDRYRVDEVEPLED